MTQEAMSIGLELTPDEWRELWGLLCNVVTNNLRAPGHVGRTTSTLLRGSETETALDPLGLEELLVLASAYERLSAVLFPHIEGPTVHASRSGGGPMDRRRRR